MARDVYSIRIFAHASLTSAGGTEGPVVPAGLVYVLRDIDIVELSGSGTAAFQVLNPLAGVLWVYQRASTLDSAYAGWRGRQVYGPGEQVGFEAASGTWSVMASGYQLTLP